MYTLREILDKGFYVKLNTQDEISKFKSICEKENIYTDMATFWNLSYTISISVAMLNKNVLKWQHENFIPYKKKYIVTFDILQEMMR